MKLIKGIHINGEDGKIRFWKLPETLEDLEIKKGQYARVETRHGEAEIEILQIFDSKNSKVRFKNFELHVTKSVISIHKF
ncbi:hypothetical protein VNN41_09800 [Lactococcus garvieae]|uniref:hypothetical protein n=1 Tax=Lactococcus garvieae TaxID=1363 RepID=UPI00325344A5